MSVTLARTHGQASVTTAAVRLSVAGSRRPGSAGTRRGYISLLRRIVRTAMKRLTYNNHTDTQDELRNAPFSCTRAHHASCPRVYVRDPSGNAAVNPPLRHGREVTRVNEKQGVQLLFVPPPPATQGVPLGSSKKCWQNLGIYQVRLLGCFAPTVETSVIVS